ncbi:MAG: M28 family peptidase [Bacteroidetes bacterium]|nr:M28 family peptidase [Bacteroidota bacterium]
MMNSIKRLRSHLTLFLITASSIVMQTHAQERLDPKKMEPVLNVADKNQIKERIKFLADDKLKGRLPGTEGYQMAVDFVTGELKKLGVAPAGEAGFIQQVKLRKSRVDTSSARFVVVQDGVETKLKYGRDFVVASDIRSRSASGEGELLFAGYGIVAPHLKHDDYQSLNVKGKIVVVRDGTPEEFPASERAHFNLALTKCEAAAKAGAAGIIILIGTNEVSRMKTIGKSMADGVTGFVLPDGSPFSTRLNLYPALGFLGYLKSSYYQSAIQGKESATKIRFGFTSHWEEIQSENIIGVIPGTDPALSKEYVVHTAHIDHVGVGVPVKGDSIYNGAHDNASGTACLLEIAKLYTKAQLRRSVLIVFVTSEEKGLLGSGYFATHPTVPVESIIADINTDMPTLIAPLLSIEPLGAKHSTLMKEVRNAAEYLKLDVMEDHMPEQVRFVRSDQYSFIRRGIPALHIKYGLKTNDPQVDLKKMIDEWTAAHYHQPSDEYREDAFDFDAAVTYVKLNFLIGWQLANETERPAWNKGDFFGQAFGKP